MTVLVAYFVGWAVMYAVLALGGVFALWYVVEWTAKLVRVVRWHREYGRSIRLFQQATCPPCQQWTVASIVPTKAPHTPRLYDWDVEGAT